MIKSERKKTQRVVKKEPKIRAILLHCAILVHWINPNEAKNNLYLLTSKDLVEEDLDMVGAEMLRADDDLVQVALKQLRDHVSVRMLVKEFMNNHRILTEIKPYRRNEPLDYHG